MVESQFNSAASADNISYASANSSLQKGKLHGRSLGGSFLDPRVYQEALGCLKPNFDPCTVEDCFEGVPAFDKDGNVDDSVVADQAGPNGEDNGDNGDNGGIPPDSIYRVRTFKRYSSDRDTTEWWVFNHKDLDWKDTDFCLLDDTLLTEPFYGDYDGLPPNPIQLFGLQGVTEDMAPVSYVPDENYGTLASHGESFANCEDLRAEFNVGCTVNGGWLWGSISCGYTGL